MSNLIKNELIKVVKKKSNIILFILSLICLMGVLVMVNLLDDSSSQIDRELVFSLESYKTRINELKDSDDVQDKREREYYKCLYENSIIKVDDWRRKALYTTCYVENKSYAKDWPKICSFVQKNDYKEYLKYKSENYKNKKYKNDFISNPIENPYKYLLDNNIGYEDKKTSMVLVLVNIQNNIEKFAMKNDSFSKEKKRTLKKQYLLLNYELENNKEVLSEFDFEGADVVTKYGLVDEIDDDNQILFSSKNNIWNNLVESAHYIIILGVFMLIIASNCVANEFSKGTIKFLIINPKKRGKIICSKYLSLLILSAIGTLIYFVFSIIINILFNINKGFFDNISMKYAYFVNDRIKIISPFFKMLSEYGYGLIYVFMVVTLAFAISSLSKNSTVATAISISIFLAGSTISMFFGELNIYWGRYFFFSNTDILSIKDGRGMYYGMSVKRSIANLVIHWIIFIMTAYDGFVRREI